jgi:hypothetical protein
MIAAEHIHIRAQPAPALVDVITALTDDNLLAPMLPGVHEGSWDAWLVVVRGLYGLPMTDEQAETFLALTGRTPPSKPSRQAYALVGRRGGKTAIASALTLYETGLRDWSGVAAPGELITGAIVAADRRQAGQALRYMSGGLEKSKALRGQIVRETGDGIELSNGAELAVMTASHRSIRGRSFASIICDELPHWYQEGASPDAEIIRAAEPALSLTAGLLLGIGTPHRRDGVMYQRHTRHWAKDDAPALAIQAPSTALNPRLPQSVVDSAMREDAQAARAEYYAQWRDDLAGYIDRQDVEKLIVPGLTSRPLRERVRYRGFIDVSGGRNDSFCWAVAHTEGDVDVLDLLVEIRPPFDPAAIVIQCAMDLKRYGLRAASGDHYAGEWVTGAFKSSGIRYEAADKNRTQIYLDALPRLTSGKVQLLDNERMVNQLVALERRTRSGGMDAIDHPRGGRDDVANAAMGALTSGSTRNLTRVTW